MTEADLTDEERERLGDVVALQPTKNSELADRWGLEGGSEVHSYLEEHLKEYYFRDENSLIRATEEAAEVSGVAPGVEEAEDGSRVVRVPDLQYHVLRVLADQDEDPQSVVGVLQAVRGLDEGLDPDNDAIREALRSLANKGVVEKVQLTVPTYRLAMSRADLQVERLDD
jgi:phosphoribosyl-ATP pyrophosphohydrolase